MNGNPMPNISRRSFLVGSTAIPLALLTPVAGASKADELVYSSVASISKAIRSGRFTSQEVVKAYLDRIDAINPHINAVVTLVAEKALEEARQADDELANGNLRGILHGVPMTIKDSFDTAGVVSTAGTLGRKSFVPQEDATVVARLKAAGAILLGKTNTPEFTMSYDTRNLLFGFTKNPYDLSKSPGGSSGGAASIVASGGSPFDMGSDTGGSIRLPSSFCGVAGIKPTTGRMPLTGHIIQTGLGAVDPLTQVGPIARFVDDLYPLLRITAGPDGKDPAVIPVPLKHPGYVQLRGLRVAFHTDNGLQPASGDVRRVVETAAAALKDAGCRVDEDAPPAASRVHDLFTSLDAFGGYNWLKRLLKQSGTERWDPHIDWHRETRSYSGEEAGQIIRDWQQARIDMTKWFSRFDALVCPVHAKASLPSGFEYDDEMIKGFSYTYVFNFTGWPGAVVRCGTSDDGMPVGVQIVARPWREDIGLAVAKFLETSLGGWQSPSI